ncbi:MAG TPA: 50S ribosomal protein L2, partial [Candidatus Omnitrophica bacterium]|nr:50S ribosomal protein L2 [Candidatus Omnitrophota bacterium]
PEKRLVRKYHKNAGRSTQGRIIVRRRGGGCKRRYRVVDFYMEKEGITGEVASIEYDPNRSAHIGLIKYPDGDKRYILMPNSLKVGDKISGGEDAPLTPGNYLPLKKIPVGTFIYNIQLDKNKKSQLVRAAGTYASLLAKEENFAHIKLPSGEIRKFSLDCKACIGQVSNIEHSSVKKGKAGKSRHLGRRPKVRGVAMNPIDHPLGGGEGRSSGGRHPTSPWGKLEKKTRKKKISDKFIVKRRK